MKMFIKIEQTAYVGAAPRINGLVGIADHKQIVMNFGQRIDQAVLQTVDVPNSSTMMYSNRCCHLRATSGFSSKIFSVSKIRSL